MLEEILLKGEGETGLFSPVEKLKAVAAFIRPRIAGDKIYAEQRLFQVISVLEANPACLRALKRLVFSVFLTADVSDVMANSGMPESDSVAYEFFKRVGHKVLPPLKNRKSIGYQISSIFNKKTDYVWVKAVDATLWERFFGLLNLSLDIRGKRAQGQLRDALTVVSYRLAMLGLEKSIVDRLGEMGGVTSAFVMQRRQVDAFLEAQSLGRVAKEVACLQAMLQTCTEAIESIKKGNAYLGTSMRETHLLQWLSILIERMNLLVSLLSNDANMEIPGLVKYFQHLVEKEMTQNSIRSYLNTTTKELAFQISEAGVSTGEHYITSTLKEYWQMFVSAVKGGAFVSVIALLKTLLHFLRLAPFWQAFGYGLNYAVGFVMLQSNGGTLATKQPAMTASAVAGALDDSADVSTNMAELAITVSKVMRSQLASLAGNILAVFPASLAIAFLWNLAFGHNLVEGAAAQHYLDQQNPLTSLCWLYAAITGVFLFLSGIISGYFENYMVHGQIGQRLREHPVHGGRFLNWLAGYLERNSGMLAGNISLGFLLGFAGFFGDIFGVPFDIRHVTFSTANVAFGLFGLGFQVPLAELLWLLLGIVFIGLFNLIVSFSLAFYVAMKSRGVSFRDYRTLAHYLKRLFFRYTFDFIWPPRNGRKAADLIRRGRFFS